MFCFVDFYVWLVGWLVLCFGLLNYITRQRALPIGEFFSSRSPTSFLPCPSVQDLFIQAGPVSTKATVYLQGQVGPNFTPFNRQKRAQSHCSSSVSEYGKDKQPQFALLLNG